MAKTSDVAAVAAVPSSADIERAAEFAREPFLLDGEGPEALAPGTARRHALDAALRELDAGAEHPSIEWRRDFSLLLGLERFLADEPPKLRDGAELNPHQVDALSGTLAELMAEQQVVADDERRNGDSSAAEAEIDAEVEAAEPSANGADPGSAEEGEGEEGEGEEGDEELEEEDEELAPDEEPQDWEEQPAEDEEEVVEEAPEDPGAARRFWFEHATGAGKTVAAVGFIEASKTGGVLILTHRRNLVDQFIGEISDRGYKERLRPPLLDGRDDPDGPVTVETYQWFVRNHKKVSDAYSIVICDEAHTALGEKTSACIRAWDGPVFIGMTATGALIARHVADLFPTQTSRFDLAQAARRGVIAPLRCLRIPPGPGVRTIAKVPLRKGEVDQDFDQEELAALLDQEPFNVAIADLYRSRFRKVPGVLYTAGVQHAKNVAKAFRAAGINAQRRLRRNAEARAGRDPRRLRTRRRRRALQRDAAGRGLELAAGDDLHAPGADRLAADLPAAGRPRHPAGAGQGGRPGDRLRPPGDDPRRVDRHPAQPARPRRLPRRRDRRRAGAARARAQGPGRAPDRPRLRRRGEADGGAGTRRSGGSRSRTSTTPSSTPGRRWPGRGSTPRAGGGRGRCCRTTAPRSCAAASC